MQQRTGSSWSTSTTEAAPRTHVYAIVRGEELLPWNWQAGFEAPLRHIGYQQIGAVVGDSVSSKSAPMTRNVLRHRRIVERLYHYFPIVPLRSGILMANDWEVSIFLAAHYQNLKWNLERLSERAEFRLRVTWLGERIRAQVERDSTSLERIRSERRARQPEESGFVSQLESLIMINEMRELAGEFSLDIHTALLSVASEGILEVVADSRQMMNGRYLVDRQEVERFLGKTQDLRTEHADLSLRMSGPMPPYSFTDVGIGSLQASRAVPASFTRATQSA